MSFINKFNSILLSIIGTLGIFLLIAFLFQVSKDLFRNNNNNKTQSQELVSEVTAKKILDFDKHKQLISFDESPICIDSVNEIYLYAINQKTLKKPENIIATDYCEGRGGMSMGREYQNIREVATRSGNFNNVIIYNALTNQTEIIFKRRISISQFTVYFDSTNSKRTIVLLGNSKDTDKDGYLSFSDLKALFIYDVDKKQMDSIDIGDASLLAYQMLGNSKKINLKIGLDRNADGKYDYEHEPAIIKIYSLETKKTDFLLDVQLTDKIQKMIDGKKVEF
jgi:hypothetical protein